MGTNGGAAVLAVLLLGALVAGCDDGAATPADGGDGGEATMETEGGADGDGDGEVGDDGEVPGEADAEAETETDADADGDADGEDGGTPWARTLAVLTGDYVTGGLALIDLDTVGDATARVATDAAAVHSDAVVVCRGGGVVDVVERAGSDRLARYAVADGAATAGAAFDLPDGSNPQDAHAIGGSGPLVVPLYEQAAASVVAADLSASTATIDLAGYADADGLPEAYRAVDAAGRLYVSLQLLDRSGTFWVPTGPGVLAVFDAATFAAIDVDSGTTGTQGIVMTGSNPWGPMRVYGPAILVSSVGEYGADDGGIEAIELATGATMGFVMSEATLGGDLGDWIVLPGDTGYAIVTVGFLEDRLVAFDLDHGSAGTPLLVTTGYTLSGLVDLGGGRIAVGDRTDGASGVRVFDVETGTEVTAAPIAVGLPPVAACVVD